MRIRFVTALFDLRREGADGRSIAWYRDRLDETLVRFPTATVYHDGCLAELATTPARGQLVRVERDELPPFGLLPQVEALQGTWQPAAPQDVTQLLPAYALIQFSKFWLMGRATDGADAVCWIDAAIGRFVPTDAAIDQIAFEQAADRLLGDGDALFEVDFRRNVSIDLRLRRPEVGSSRRVLSGTSFLIRQEALDAYARGSYSLAQSWLTGRAWDNEQVALAHLVSSKGFRPTLMRSSSRVPGAVARIADHSERLQALAPSTPLHRLLTRPA